MANSQAFPLPSLFESFVSFSITFYFIHLKIYHKGQQLAVDRRLAKRFLLRTTFNLSAMLYFAIISIVLKAADEMWELVGYTYANIIFSRFYLGYPINRTLDNSNSFHFPLRVRACLYGGEFPGRQRWDLAQRSFPVNSRKH